MVAQLRMNNEMMLQKIVPSFVTYVFLPCPPVPLIFRAALVPNLTDTLKYYKAPMLIYKSTP